MISLAAVAMALGMGDGAQRLARRRRGRISNPRVQATRGAEVPMVPERPEETPALLTPPTAFH